MAALNIADLTVGAVELSEAGIQDAIFKGTATRQSARLGCSVCFLSCPGRRGGSVLLMTGDIISIARRVSDLLDIMEFRTPKSARIVGQKRQKTKGVRWCVSVLEWCVSVVWCVGVFRIVW